MIAFTRKAAPVVTDKGTQIMEGLLLSQYLNSTNLLGYLKSYIEEMDYLFETIENVFNGRLLLDAVGAQLDIIGVILNQSRNVDLGGSQFGFQGAPLVEGFASLVTPNDGGVFRSETQASATVAPLTDETYRRVLMCKASLLNSNDLSINTMYKAIIVLLNKVPRSFSITEADRSVHIEVSALDVSANQQLLIHTMSKYYLPAGVYLTSNLI